MTRDQLVAKLLISGHTPDRPSPADRVDFDFSVDGEVCWFIIVRDPNKFCVDALEKFGELAVCMNFPHEDLYTGSDPSAAWTVVEGLLGEHR